MHLAVYFCCPRPKVQAEIFLFWYRAVCPACKVTYPAISYLFLVVFVFVVKRRGTYRRAFVLNRI